MLRVPAKLCPDAYETGSKTGFLLRQDGDLVPFDVRETPRLRYDTNWEAEDYAAIILYQKARNEWTSRWIGMHGNIKYGWNSSLSKLVDSVQAAQYAEDSYADKLTSDPAFALEEALKGHDWYYMYSDDGSVCRAGDRALDRITALQKQVPAALATKLWNQYCPWAEEKS